MLDQYNITFADTSGQRWNFAYTGGTSIKIRPQSETGDGVPDTEWTNQIDLNAYSMSPGRVTTPWINTRAAAWIKGRNSEIAAGLYG